MRVTKTNAPQFDFYPFKDCPVRVPPRAPLPLLDSMHFIEPNASMLGRRSLMPLWCPWRSTLTKRPQPC